MIFFIEKSIKAEIFVPNLKKNMVLLEICWRKINQSVKNHEYRKKTFFCEKIQKVYTSIERYKITLYHYVTLITWHFIQGHLTKLGTHDYLLLSTYIPNVYTYRLFSRIGNRE